MSTASGQSCVQTGTSLGFHQSLLKPPPHHYALEITRSSKTDGTEALSNAASEDASTSLAKLKSEKMLVDASIHDLEAQIEMTSQSRPNEITMKMLHALRETLQEDVTALRHHVKAYKDADPQWVEEKREETEAMRSQAEKWMNNIDILEGWLRKALGAEQMERLREDCYGADDAAGEVLGD